MLYLWLIDFIWPSVSREFHFCRINLCFHFIHYFSSTYIIKSYIINIYWNWLSRKSYISYERWSFVPFIIFIEFHVKYCTQLHEFWKFRLLDIFFRCYFHFHSCNFIPCDAHGSGKSFTKANYHGVLVKNKNLQTNAQYKQKNIIINKKQINNFDPNERNERKLRRNWSEIDRLTVLYLTNKR